MVYMLSSSGIKDIATKKKAHSSINVPEYQIRTGSTYGHIVISIIKTLLFIYDIISYPIYLLLKKFYPIKESYRTSNINVGPSDPKTGSYHGRGSTMNEIFTRSISRYDSRSCLGYRAVVTCPVLAIDDDGNSILQDKSFRSDYTWYTYEQIGRRVHDIASGLYYHSIYPDSRALFLASACLEWFIASQACFQIGAKLVVAPDIRRQSSLVKIIERTDVEVIFASCNKIDLLVGLFNEIKSQLIGVVKMKKVILIDWQFTVDFNEPQFRKLRDSSRHIVDRVLSMGQVEEIGVENPTELSCTEALNQNAIKRSATRASRSCNQAGIRDRFKRPSKSMSRCAEVSTYCGRDDILMTLDDLLLDPSCFMPKTKPTDQIQSNSRVLKPEELAIISYTHGSAGELKGIMITHDYIARSVDRMQSDGIVEEGETYCSMSPIDHFVEFITEVCVLAYGGSIGYSCGPNTLFYDGKGLFPRDLSDIEALNPTLLITRPYILERLRVSAQDYIALQINPLKSFILKNIIFDYKKYWARRCFGTPITDLLFCHDINRLFGTNLKRILCDGLTDCSETRDFFAYNLNTPIKEIYGPDEAPMSLISGHICKDTTDSPHYMNVNGLARHVSTSPIMYPTSGTRIKFEDWKNFRSDSGQLLIGGDVVCNGLIEVSHLSIGSSTFIDSHNMSWFRSNYIGRLSSNGGVEIISSISDMIEIADEQYISLSQIEHILKASQFVDNVCAICDNNKKLVVALIVPNLRLLALKSPDGTNLKDTIGLDTEPEELTDLEFRREVCNDRLLCESLNKHLNRLLSNANLHSLPSRFLIVPEIWTPESELVTPSFEPRRCAIQKYYASDIESLYRINTDIRSSARMSSRSLRSSKKYGPGRSGLSLTLSSGARLSY